MLPCSHKAPDLPQITRRRPRPAASRLGRSASGVAKLLREGRADDIRELKVCEQPLAEGAPQHIGPADVAVHEATRVQRLKCAEHRAKGITEVTLGG